MEETIVEIGGRGEEGVIAASVVIDPERGEWLAGWIGDFSAGLDHEEVSGGNVPEFGLGSKGCGELTGGDHGQMHVRNADISEYKVLLPAPMGKGEMGQLVLA